MEIPGAVSSNDGRARILKSRRTAALVLIFFTALTVLHLFPLSLRPLDMVHDPGDPLLNAWILSWVGHQAFRNPFALFDANIFYPHRNTLAFSEHMLPLALVAAPLNILFDNPVLASNIVLLLTFVLNAFGMFLLVRRLTGNDVAGIASGIVFAFSSYKIMHVSHLQLLAAMGIPLSFLYLHKFLADRRWKDSVLFALFFALQALACIYYGLFSIAVFSLILPLALLLHARTLKASFFVRLGVPLLVAGACLFLFSLPYEQTFKTLGLNRGLTAGAELQNYFAAGPKNFLWGGLLSRWGSPERFLFPGLAACLLTVFALLGLKKPAEPAGGRPRRALARVARVAVIIFVVVNLVSIVAVLAGGVRIAWGPLQFSATEAAKPALAIFLLAVPLFVIRIVRMLRSKKGTQRRRWILLYAAVVYWSAMLSFGGGFKVFGRTTSVIPLPFTFFFRHLTGFTGIREPARFAVFVLFGVSVLAGFGWAGIAGRMTNGSLRRVLGIALIAVLNIEYLSLPIEGNLVPVGRDVPPTYAWLKTQPQDAVILELPLLDWQPGESLYLYFSTFHRRNLVNGYSGFIPASAYALREIFRDFPSRDSVDTLSALGVSFVIVHAGWIAPEWVWIFAKSAEARFGEELRLEKRFQYASSRPHLYREFLGDDLVFSVHRGRPVPNTEERRPEDRLPSISRDGWRFEVSDNPEAESLMTDGNPGTAWTTGKPKYPGAFIRIDLKNVYNLRLISLAAGLDAQGFGLDFRIESSEDGTTWRAVPFRYDKTEFLLDLIRDQKRARQYLRLEDGRARYLKIVQTGRGDEAPWSVAELRLYGQPEGPAASPGDSARRPEPY